MLLRPQTRHDDAVAVHQQVGPWQARARIGDGAHCHVSAAPTCSACTEPRCDRCAEADRTACFADRSEAGRTLGAMLAELGYEAPVVVGIAPGGMAVAAEVARLLEAPLHALTPPADSSNQRSGLKLALADAVVILVDDQLVSDGVVREAVRALRRQGAARVTLAVPVAASVPAAMARRWVDDLLCAAIRVGDGPLDQLYEDFGAATATET